MANETEQTETTEQVEDVEQTADVTGVALASTVTNDTAGDDALIIEEATKETEEKPDDLLTAAIAEKARLEAELEALKSSDDGNIFEQNAILKSELEDAQKLQEMAVENAELKSKLEGIKRETIIKSLNLTEKMTTWADSLTFKQLEEFATMTPRRKTILDARNNAGEESSTITKFKEEQETSRIM